MSATWLGGYFKTFPYANKTINRNDVNVSNSNFKITLPCLNVFRV